MTGAAARLSANKNRRNALLVLQCLCHHGIDKGPSSAPQPMKFIPFAQRGKGSVGPPAM
jgi:hypothetical protein